MNTEAALVSTLLNPEIPGERTQLTPFPGRRAPDRVIFPTWIYVKDRDGLYLSERGPGPAYHTLTFRSGDPNLDCAFKVVPNTGNANWNEIRARSGNDIVCYNSSWFSSDAPGYILYFNAITTTGNKVYLKDNAVPARFFSNELNSSGAPVVHNFINDSSLMEIVQASIKNEVVDVHYDIDGAAVRSTEPKIALSTSVRNDSDGPVNQTLTYTYEKWSVGTWNNSAGVEVGVKSSFEAGVPFVSNAKFEISVTTSYSHEWGGEEGVRESITSSTTVTVPPKKKARATVIIRNAFIDVGFTYTQKVLWSNGQSEEFKKNGIYNNVDSWHVDVELDNWEDV